MLGALLILLAMPVLDTGRVRGSQFRPLMRGAFWVLVADFFLLMYIGSQHAAEPFVTIGAAATAVYFGWFVILVPLVGIIENTLIDVARSPETNFNYEPIPANTPLVRLILSIILIIFIVDFIYPTWHITDDNAVGAFNLTAASISD